MTPNPNTRSRLLRADELAELLAVPTSHVYRLARERGLPAVRLGRYVRFDLADVERWLDRQKRDDDGR